MDLTARVHNCDKAEAFKEFRENVFMKAPKIALGFREIRFMFR